MWAYLVVPTFDNECISLPPHNVDLRYEKAVDIPVEKGIQEVWTFICLFVHSTFFYVYVYEKAFDDVPVEKGIQKVWTFQNHIDWLSNVHFKKSNLFIVFFCAATYQEIPQPTWLVMAE